MARKHTAPPPASDRSGVTPERFERLVRLLQLLAEKPLSRDALTRRLAVDVRGFYRDLGLVRGAGVQVDLLDGRYRLASKLPSAVGLLPFPDPHLTLSEVRLLSRGRTPAHRKLRDQLGRVPSDL
jgi:hypothetical protein